MLIASTKKPQEFFKTPKSFTHKKLFDSPTNGAKRIRTADPCNAIAVLYQLSYNP
jgi:hypothetical protein